MDENLDLNVNLILNGPEVKAEASKAKTEITGVATSAEASAKKVEASVKRIAESNEQLLARYAKNAREAEALFQSKQPKAEPAAKNNIKDAASEVINLKNANESNNKAQQEGADILEDLSLATFTWTGLISLAGSLILLYKQEIYDWAKALITGREANDKLALSQEALNEALGSGVYKDTIANVVELQQMVIDAKNGFIDKAKVVDHYNETMGKTAGVVKTVDEVQRKLTENGDAYIEMVLKQATANIVLEKAATKAAEAEQRKLDGPTVKDYVSAGLKSVANVFSGGVGASTSSFFSDAEINKTMGVAQLTKESKQGIELYKELTAAKDKFAKDNGLNIFQDNKVEKDKKVTDKTIEERKSLLAKLDAIDKEYTRKSFTKDEEELQALRDKFAAIRQLVLDFNKANPKKAISLVALNILEGDAESDLKYRQQTSQFKTSLDEQKKLYDAFEEYKLTFGEAAAKERFGKQINVEQTYLDKVKTAYALTYSAGITQGFSGKIQERLKVQGTIIKAETEAEQKKNDQLLKDFQTYTDKRKVIQEKFETIAQNFRRDGKNKEAKEAVDKGTEELRALDESNIKKWDSYRKLFDNIERLSKKDTLNAIAQFQKQLNAADITADARIAAQKKIDGLKSTIEKGSGKQLEQTARLIAGIARDFSDIDSNIINIANVLVQAAQSYVEIKKGISDYKKASEEGDTTGKISAGIGIFGAAVGVANAVFGYFKGLKQAKIEAQKNYDDFYSKVALGELNYQGLLRERERTESAANAKRLAGMQKQFALLKQQSSEIDKQFQQVMAQLQGQSEGQITGANYVHGTWLRKAKTDYTYGSLAGKDYDQLEQLYTQGKLTDGAKALFEQLQKLKAEGADVTKTLADIAEAASEMFTGTTADSLTDSLLEMFRNGKTGAQDLANFFKDAMSESALSIFKNKVIAANMDKFYEEFAKKAQSGDGIDTSEYADLQKLFDSLNDDAVKKFEDLKKATGLDLSKSGNTSNATGAIRAELTEDTGSKLLGLYRSQYDVSKLQLSSAQEGLKIFRDLFLLQKSIADNTLRTADNTQNLEKKLDAIIANTKQPVTARGGGI